MEVLQAIRTRRSIRKFKSKKIPDAVLYTILESARWAPSAGNLQPWRIIVVEDREKKELLASESDQDFVAKAPVVFVVCSDPSVCETEYDELGGKFCVQGVAAAIQNILITAHSFGLGAVWVGTFVEPKIRKALQIPDGTNIDAVIPIGFPDETPKRKATLEMSDYVNFEKFGEHGRSEDMFPITEQVKKIKGKLKEYASKLKGK